MVFSSIWKNLKHLSALIKNKTNQIKTKQNEPYKIDLFDLTPGGLTPMTNSFLMARVDLAIKRTHKNETQVCIMDRIQTFIV